MEALIELKFINSSFSSLSSYLTELDKQFPVEQFEPTVSQSAVSSPPPPEEADDSGGGAVPSDGLGPPAALRVLADSDHVLLDPGARGGGVAGQTVIKATISINNTTHKPN